MPMKLVPPILYTPIEGNSLKPMDYEAYFFPENVNKDIAELNLLVEAYNLETNHGNKLDKLKAIYTKYQSINYKFSLSVITGCASYQKNMHEIFFNDMTTASRELGLSSLTQLTSDATEKVDDSSLPAIIANMPYNKIQRLMTILWMNQDVSEQIGKLYQPDEPGYKAFQAFLKTHTLTVLSGKGNSRNLKVERTGTGAPVVLKLDPRLGRSKRGEDQLRSNGFHHLCRIHDKERYATFRIGPNISTAALVITDFFPNGDLSSTMKMDLHSKDERIGSTLLYYQQMANILLEMQQKQVAFPDAKNENWLVDATNHLNIADTKSFLSVNDSGQIKTSEAMTSSHMLPPEIFDKDPISVEQMHVYLLGKAMYHYVTQCDRSEMRLIDGNREKLYREHNKTQSPIAYDHAVFKTPLGIKLNALIQRMLTPNPQNRISLQEALRALKNLGHELSSAPEQQACKAMLEEMKAHHEAEDIIHDVEKTLKEGMLIEIHDLPKKIQNQKERLFAECASHINMLKDCNPAYMGEAPDKSSIGQMRTLLAELKNEVQSIRDACINALKDEINKLNLPQEDPDIQRIITEKTNEINQAPLSKISMIQHDLPVEINQLLKSGCHQALNDIMKAIDSQNDPKSQNDPNIQAYISKKLTEINSKSPRDLPALAKELNDFKEKLCRVYDLVHETQKKLNSGFWRGLQHEQAKKISDTFKAIPLEDRINVFSHDNQQNPTAEIKAFHDALSLHTGFGSTKKNQALSSNTSTAERSPTFHNFKKRFHQLMSPAQQNGPQSDKHEEESASSSYKES